MKETVPVYVVERRDGSRELGARGWGWPEHEETAEGLDSFTSALSEIGEEIELEEHEPDELVAELTVRRIDAIVTGFELVGE